MARPKRPDSRSTIAQSSEKSEDVGGTERDDFLGSIDRLLKTVAELMEKEPALDRQAFEHLRQLRVRIRFAMQAAASDPVNVILAARPPKFTDRVDKHESATDFLRREYSQWLGTGLLRSDLKKIDKSLYDALNNWAAKHGPLPADIDLPTKTALIDTKLKKAGVVKAPSRTRRISEMSQAEREQLRLYDVARHRKKSDH